MWSRRSGTWGFGAGVNAGAANLGEDVLVLLNNDAVAAPGFLDALTTPLRTGAVPMHCSFRRPLPRTKGNAPCSNAANPGWPLP